MTSCASSPIAPTSPEIRAGGAASLRPGTCGDRAPRGRSRATGRPSAGRRLAARDRRAAARSRSVRWRSRDDRARPRPWPVRRARRSASRVVGQQGEQLVRARLPARRRRNDICRMSRSCSQAAASAIGGRSRLAIGMPSTSSASGVTPNDSACRRRRLATTAAQPVERRARRAGCSAGRAPSCAAAPRQAPRRCATARGTTSGDSSGAIYVTEDRPSNSAATRAFAYLRPPHPFMRAVDLIRRKRDGGRSTATRSSTSSPA